ncbi:DUF554 domain-containing protein [uncultured Granulicatella sp.]|uniref:DUF554 domain-containing protein n=1 Tax=uncultured Granulicatella sp. TaxID=316089 RepID=UPI0028D2F2D7|nr:DUF554 domain-containing protein [uncultured Granulicatella sp.]
MGVIINVIAIVIGTMIGLFLKRGMSEKMSSHIMQGLALITFIIGLKGALVDQDMILLIVSISLGGYLGEMMQLEENIRKFAEWVQDKLSKEGAQNQLAEGFVSAVLIFCVGAMAVMGSLEAGLRNNHGILITKALIDGFASIILTTTKGAGVMLSALAILLYEGGMMVLAQFVAPYLSESIVYAMSAVGSLLLVALGLNLLELTKIKVMNFLPAMFLPIVLIPLLSLIRG